jgi:hypothetical protein
LPLLYGIAGTISGFMVSATSEKSGSQFIFGHTPHYTVFRSILEYQLNLVAARCCDYAIFLGLSFFVNAHEREV